MLLRRITEHVKAQNWFAVFLDFIVVVLGIFVALEVSNYKEAKQSAAFETKMLVQIQAALSNDISYFEGIRNRLEPAFNANQTLLKHLYKKEDIDEKELLQLLDDSFIGYVFSYNKGAYEALKASGLDKVKNDDLRNQMVHFYDFTAPRTATLIQYRYRDNGREALYRNRLALMELGPVFSEELNAYDVARTRVKPNVLTSPILLEYVEHANGLIMHARFRLKMIKEEAVILDNALTNELKKRKAI
ncbi:hypothetical protein [Thalassotalea agarivorans]|uniref:Uncharacterized protein n=1 Tax=Thalassotalea agarivorans TaxID=349064 RepID=A0A1H9ZLZ6_THASX|nr:hypothetical protein [Thalassotalea agarivorans]SES82189.1 hypothetical protein SAMN05660429_00491 [Thalassotalea agarivorans]